MHNRLKELHECYMSEKQDYHVATESVEHQRMMKDMVAEMFYINEMMDKPEHYDRINGNFRKDHCPINNAPLTRDEAHAWVSHMKPTGGGNWTPWTVEQSNKLMSQHGVSLGTLSDWCANALLNMLWSDNPAKTPDQILVMAKDYVADPDTVPAGEKLGIYYRYIAKH